MSGRVPTPLDWLKERLVGGSERLGWWTAPLFIAVGLLGAVLAGTIAAVYYAQKVEALREETEAARQELSTAVEQVREAAEEALAEIEAEVAAVRDELAVTTPIEDAAEAGIVSVRTTVVVRPEQQAPPPAGPGQTEPPARQEPARPAETEDRVGSGFAVVQSGGQTFFVTAFGVLADPQRPGFPVPRAEVRYANTTVAGEVHAWDPARDLALVRVTGVPRVQIPEWRPEEEPVEPGSRLFAVGITPVGIVSELAAAVAGVDAQAVLLGAALPDVNRGGPVVDGAGRVVAIGSTGYQPSGTGGAATSAVPVRALCQSLIRCGDGSGVQERDG